MISLSSFAVLLASSKVVMSMLVIDVSTNRSRLVDGDTLRCHYYGYERPAYRWVDWASGDVIRTGDLLVINTCDMDDRFSVHMKARGRDDDGVLIQCVASTSAGPQVANFSLQLGECKTSDISDIMWGIVAISVVAGGVFVVIVMAAILIFRKKCRSRQSEHTAADEAYDDIADQYQELDHMYACTSVIDGDVDYDDIDQKPYQPLYPTTLGNVTAHSTESERSVHADSPYGFQDIDYNSSGHYSCAHDDGGHLGSDNHTAGDQDRKPVSETHAVFGNPQQDRPSDRHDDIGGLSIWEAGQTPANNENVNDYLTLICSSDNH